MTTMTTTTTTGVLLLILLACMTDAWVPSCSVVDTRKSITQVATAAKHDPTLSRTKMLLRASTSSSSASTTTTTTSTSSSSSTAATTQEAAAAAATNIQEHAIVLDGAEWASVHRHLKQQQPQRQVDLSKCAVLNLVTARNNKGEAIIGLRVMVDHAATTTTAADNNNTTILSPDISIYTDSMAVIPSSISIQDAVRTYPNVWTCVQTMLPLNSQDKNGIGGASSPDNTDANNINNNNAFHRVVVLGGNEHACMAATALSALDCQVTLVTTGKPAMPLNNNDKKSKNIHVIEPAIGDVGFAQFVHKFDALLDTVGNELGDDIDDESSSFAMPSPNSVLRLLEKRHDCTQYASTRTHQEAILGKEGLLFGPGKAKKYVPSSKSVVYPPPPRHLGDTVQRLFQAGIVWPAKAVPTHTVQLTNNNNASRQATLRGWTLKAYWESTTWPRDSNGSGNTRYGLPVIDDSEFIAPLLDAPYAQVEAPPMPFERVEADVPQDYNANHPSSSFVSQVHGVTGLKEHIVDSKLDCVLFLSAPYCRTCNRINPFYQRMARVNEQAQQSSDSDDEIPITFCRADATGLAGKELGRHLNVNAVPTFVLFKKGKQYGFPLAISRLPSKKLERAISYLKTGRSWDDDAFLDEEGTGRRTKLT